MEEEAKKEARLAKQKAKPAKWKPGQPIPTAAALTSKPDLKY